MRVPWAVALLVVIGCERPSPPDPLVCRDCNLVVVSLTNVRRDHVGLYGYQRPTTPTIDRFFADAVVLENAFAPASWTLPVATSIMTGVYPYDHGVMNRHQGQRLDDGWLTLAELLRRRGWITAAFTGGGDYNRQYNVSQGFDFYLDEENYDGLGIRPHISEGRGKSAAYLSVAELIPHAVPWVRRHASSRFFLWVQGFDAHCPFMPPAPYDRAFDPDYAGTVDFSDCLWTFDRVTPIERGGERLWPVKSSFSQGVSRDVLLSERDLEHMKARYDGDIASADAALGPLFAALSEGGLLDRTIVLFLSEHGDLFGEHGRFMRGGSLRGTFYEPVLHVPVAMRHPRVSGRRLSALVELTDLLPTLVAGLGVDDPQSQRRRGTSLLPLLDGRRQRIHDRVVAGSRFTACRNPLFSGVSVSEAIQTDRWKLMREAIREPTTRKLRQQTTELFAVVDGHADELRPVDDKPEVVEQLRDDLDAALAKSRDRLADHGCPPAP